MAKRKRKRAPRCAFCNAPMDAVEHRYEPICSLCRSKGRKLLDDGPEYDEPSQPPAADEEFDDYVGEEEVDEEPRRRSHRPTAFLIGMGIVLLLWAGLTGISLVAPNFLYALIACGGFIALVGIFWLFYAAEQDGIAISAFVSRNPMMLVIVFVIQAAVAPVFTVVYLFLNFEEGWKPAVLEFAGIAMVATGFLMLRMM